MLGRRSLIAGALALPTTALASGGASGGACEVEPQTRALLNDWPELARYAEANRQLIASRQPVEVVFIGDSITQGWPDKRPAFFAPGRINRGIGGQTTPQMLLRMMADVIALRPRSVHIMGGTNDIAGNTGPITPQQTVANVEAMVVLARAHRIRVLIGTVPPAGHFPWRPGLETRAAIARINAMLAAMARRTGARLVDYTPALADPMGAMKPGFAYDGVHPDVAGYAAMEGVLAPLIGTRRSQPKP